MHPYAPAKPQFHRMSQVVTNPVVVSPARTAVTSLITLGVLGSAAYVGIKTGMDNRKNKSLQALGYIGGIGAGLLGLAAISNLVLPQVTPTLLLPFNLPVA